LGKFLVVTGGGTIIGLLSGYLVYAILKRIDDHLLEVAITVVMTFGTPLLAEAFHFSGIIAIVVACLIIGNFGKIHSMSDKTREVLENFWEVIEFLINSILFLVIGVELQVMGNAELSELWKPVGVVLLTVLVSRGIVVYPIVAFKNMISSNDIPWKWSHILFWGGLRGSLSIALVVGLPDDIERREYFLALAFAMVLFSLIVQGLTMKPLISQLGLSQKTGANPD
jgi:CPA1 family monovalent cation:H+ antiporter